MIFKFYPEEFTRQYVVAKDYEEAQTMEKACFDAYFDECLGWLTADMLEDDLDWTIVIEKYHAFSARFKAMHVHPVTFVDTHY